MTRWAIRPLKTLLLAGFACLAPVAAAEARTLYVANNGVDNPVCGSLNPCRSITQALARAVARDTIIVGPGVYGDLNHNGDLGDPGEETGSSYCRCMIRMDKAVALISRDGAAATVIDARGLSLDRNVYVVGGGEFGRPGQGFTVTRTGSTEGNGSVAALTIESFTAKVRGNQILAHDAAGYPYVSGIRVLGFGGAVLVEGNEVRGWGLRGISLTGSGTTVRKNAITTNTTGIWAQGNNVIQNNVIAVNNIAMRLHDQTSVVGNAVYGNYTGIQVDSSFTGTIEQNNIFGNHYCALNNDPGVPFLMAPNNYWGAAAGPGLDPADTVCNGPGKMTQVTPVATRPFVVTAPIDP